MGTLKTARRTCSIADFVKQLRQLPAHSFERLEDVRSFLVEHVVDSQTLAPYVCWDSQHYTRNLIDKTPLYELLAICWEVGQISSIHNHRGQNCWMAVPIGRLMVQNYRVLLQDLQAGRCKIERTFAVEMNAESPVAVDPKAPVHKVYNAKEFAERAVSLHIYSRPFDSCDVYSEDQQTCGTIKLSYTTEYGKRRAQTSA
ncbi:MAG TPA: cysteine dioxygenase family protein [Terriglobales bacterium]|nr:cysteine dioxygenase family protein [Terriglobales bacterium]